jgi:hypothetical protein
MKKAVDVTLVTHAIGAVRAIGYEMSGKTDWEHGREQSRAAARSAVAQLEDYGARVRDDWRGARITLCGISSTSTGGIRGAIMNWLRAAEAKIGGAA